MEMEFEKLMVIGLFILPVNLLVVALMLDIWLTHRNNKEEKRRNREDGHGIYDRRV